MAARRRSRGPAALGARPIIAVGFAVGPEHHSEHHGGPPDPGRRLVIFSMLFALPIFFAVLAHRFADPYLASEAETVLIFGLIPQALLPLLRSLYASGMVQDEVEEQTLTYLLIRPIPRWLIYVVKVVATWLVASALATVFTAEAALVAVYWGVPGLSPTALAQGRAHRPDHELKPVRLRRHLRRAQPDGTPLPGRGGGIYRGVRGSLANIDFVMRRVTVMYYLRVLSCAWLDLAGADWSIDPATAPSDDHLFAHPGGHRPGMCSAGIGRFQSARVPGQDTRGELSVTPPVSGGMLAFYLAFLQAPQSLCQFTDGGRTTLKDYVAVPGSTPWAASIETARVCFS